MYILIILLGIVPVTHSTRERDTKKSHHSDIILFDQFLSSLFVGSLFLTVAA
jgi:hypothetical protein